MNSITALHVSIEKHVDYIKTIGCYYKIILGKVPYSRKFS